MKRRLIDPHRVLLPRPELQRGRIQHPDFIVMQVIVWHAINVRRAVRERAVFEFMDLPVEPLAIP